MVIVAVEAVDKSSKLFNNSKLQGKSGEIEVYQSTTLVSNPRKTLLARVIFEMIAAFIISFLLKFTLISLRCIMGLLEDKIVYQGQEEFDENNKMQRRKDFKNKRNKTREDKNKSKSLRSKIITNIKISENKKYSGFGLFKAHYFVSHQASVTSSENMWEAFRNQLSEDELEETEEILPEYKHFDYPDFSEEEMFEEAPDLETLFENSNPVEETGRLYAALSRITDFKKLITKKDFEIWIAYFYAMYKSVDLMHACSITVLCLHNYMPSSFFDILKSYTYDMMKPRNKEDHQSGEFVAKVKDIIKTWKHIKNSEFIGGIKKIVALSVAAGMCQLSAIPFSKELFEKFYKTSGVSKISKIDFVDQFLETIVFIYEKFYMFYMTGDIMSFFYSEEQSGEYEKEYTTLISTLTLLQTGNLNKNDFDEHSYENRVDKLIAKTEDLVKTTSGVEKKLFADRLLRLKTTKVAILDYHKSMALRERPFSFLMFGGSGVGKSTMLPKIINALLQANNLDTSDDLIVTLQANDAFQSEYRTKHTVVILDDIANSTPEHCEANPNNVIINFVNNIPAYALNPIAELKGKILISPKFFIGTTNNKDLFANIYSVEPISILRRFDYTITVSVKEEYLKDGRLNTDIVSGFNIDAWEFCVEVPYAINRPGSTVKKVGYNVVEYNGQKLNNCSLGRLIGFLSKMSQEHFVKQKILINTSESAMGSPVCEHFSYADICPDCLHDQAGFDNISEKVLQQWQKIPNVFFNISSRVRIRVNAIPKIILVNVLRLPIFKNIIYSIILYNVLICYLFMLLINSAIYIPAFCVVILPPFFALILSSIIILIYVEMTKKYIIRMPIKTLHNLVSKIKPYKRYGIKLVQFMAIIIAIRSLYKLYLRYITKNQGSTVSIPHPGENEQVNVWKKPILTPIITFPEISNMTEEQVVDLVGKSLAHATFENSVTLKCCRCDIFPVKSNFWLAPWHVLSKNYDKINVIRTDPEFIGPNFNARLSSSSYVRIGNTDLGIIYIPAGGDTRNMLKLFPQTHIKINMPGKMVYKDRFGNLTYDEFNCAPQIFKKDDSIYVSHTYNCNFATFEGLCMATIISKAKKPVIIGFHLAGVTNGSKGISQNITYEEIIRGIEDLCKDTIAFQTADQVNVDFNVPELGIKHVLTIHDKSPSRFLSDGACLNHLGSHTGNRRKFTSQVIKTFISDSVEKHTGKPCLYGPPKYIGTYRPWQEELEKLTHLKKLVPDILEIAYEDFHQHIFDYLELHPEDKTRIHPIANVTILSGADGVYGIDSINLDASSGWPLNVKKSKLVHEIDPEGTGATRALDCDPSFWAHISELEDILAKGERVYFINRANLKDEPTKLTKDGVRVFAGTSFECSVLVRKYFLTTCKYIMEHSELFECAVGVNHCGPGWTKLTNKMLKFGRNRVIAGDYKHFDSSMPCEVTLSAMEILIDIAAWAGYTERQLAIMRGLATELCMPVYEFNGEFIQVNGSNPSGHSLTVFLNNIVNSIYLRYAYYDIYDMTPPGVFSTNVSVMCYGDDNKMSVREGCDLYNHTAIANSMAKCGIVYTMADKEAVSVPFITNEDCNFLKRSSIWNSKYERYLAPLEINSIFKSLHCVLKSKSITEEEQASACILNAMREFFQHGEVEYNIRRKQLDAVIDECNLRPFLPNDRIPTFEEEEHIYMENNNLLI